MRRKEKKASAAEVSAHMEETTAEAAEAQETSAHAKEAAAKALRVEELEAELARERYKHRFYRALLSTICTLIVVAAAAILAANLWLPILRVSGDSMTPTLSQGDVVAAIRTDDLESGDLIAFYYNNKILVKRVIATSGQWVNITDDGTVYVDDIKLEEPYLDEKALGECTIELPYQVPESRVFVMGDHRSVSVDSRSESVGCVAAEQIVGKIVFRIWPFSELGVVK